MAAKKRATAKGLKKGKRLGGSKLQRASLERVTLQRRVRGGRRGSLY